MLVDHDETPFGGDIFGHKAQVGGIADGDKNRVRRQQLAVSEHDAIVSDLLGEAGPAELGTDFFSLLTLLAEGEGLLDVDQGDVIGAQTVGFAGHVTAHVAGADDHDTLADAGASRLGIRQKIERREQALLAGYRHHPRLLGTGRQNDEIVVFTQLGHVVLVDRLLQMDMRDDLAHALELGRNHVLGNPAAGNRRGDLAAQQGRGVEHRGLVAAATQLPGHRNTGGSATDHGHFAPAQRRQGLHPGLDAGLAQAADVHRGHEGRLPGATRHAQVGAEVAAYRGRKRGETQGQVHGLVHPTLAHQPPALVHRNAAGAGGLAGSGIFAVFPDRYEPPQLAGDDHRNLAAILVAEIADDPAPSQLLVPDLLMKGGHRTGLAGFFLVGAAGRDHLPLGAVRQILGQRLATDALQKDFDVVLQPLPVVVTDGHQLGVPLAVAAMGSTEKNLATHHSDEGAVAQHVVGILGIDAADHGNAPGHELPEIIPHRSQHPELGRRKARVALGHGHTAGTDITGHPHDALGHGIGGAVAGVAVNDDLGPGIEPAGVVRSRSMDLDRGVGKSHRPQALPGRTLHPHVQLFVAGFPEPPPDAVLAEGQNLQVACAVGHGLLNLFFQDPGFDAFAILLAADDMIDVLILMGFTAHALNLHGGAVPAIPGSGCR